MASTILPAAGLQNLGTAACAQAGSTCNGRECRARVPSAAARLQSRRYEVQHHVQIAHGAHSNVAKKRATRQHPCRRRTAVECSANGAPKGQRLRVVISGAPASGKGTQCEKVVEKHGLTHISAGDLLRAEVEAGSEYGKRVKEFMDAGNLVPDDVVVTIVKERLAKEDAQTNGWLLDGYPRSASQAAALEQAGIRPDIFISLKVKEDSLVERVVGRRLDPTTGRIYHMKFSPPENDEVTARLTQRSDDTEEKVKNRLNVYHTNLASVENIYADVLKTVDGNKSQEEVFADIDRIISEAKESQASSAGREEESSPQEEAKAFRVPTKMNTIPHPREMRAQFYKDACRAASRAVQDGLKRLEIRLLIPELNPEMDVYRIGTLLELIRELAFTFSDDGKRVKVCVQGSMGEGIFSGMPLALAGTRRLMEMMDWGNEDDKAQFIRFGAVGAKFVDDEDDVIIVMAPQNAVGNCIIEDLENMVEAAGDRPLIIVNPRLKDVPSAAGVMQVTGRAERLNFQASFFKCYQFRLLYKVGTNMYPIIGAYRYAYPGKYEIYKRDLLGEEWGDEVYNIVGVYDRNPTREQIAEAFRYKKPKEEEAVKGSKPFWQFW